MELQLLCENCLILFMSYPLFAYKRFYGFVNV